MKRVTNKEAASLTQRREIFETVNQTIFSRRLRGYDIGHGDYADKVYVVYSYGDHFPMYVYDYGTGQWYGNANKYSVTTSRHQTLTRPDVVSRWFGTDELRRIISAGGLAEAVVQRIESAAVGLLPMEAQRAYT